MAKAKNNGPRRLEAGAPSDRRAEAVTAAVDVLAQQGSRGLTHGKVDQRLGWTLGSTSNYFRRRNDLFIAIAERVIQMDHADLAVLVDDGAKPGEKVIDLFTRRVARLLDLWMSPAHRIRAFARAEILFESSRNPEVQAASKVLVNLIEMRLKRIFAVLGAPDPDTSAALFSLLITSMHLSVIFAKTPPSITQLETLVRSWILISVEQRGKPPRARVAAIPTASATKRPAPRKSLVK